MKTLRYVGVAVLTIMLCVNFTACSDDNDEEKQPTTPPEETPAPPQEETPTTPATLAGQNDCRAASRHGRTLPVHRAVCLRRLPVVKGLNLKCMLFCLHRLMEQAFS